MKNLFKNPGKIMGLVKSIGGKLDAKMKSGDLNESELLEEASEIVDKMKDMPGLKNMMSQMGMPGGNFDVKGMANKMQQSMKQAKMKERMQEKLRKNKYRYYREHRQEYLECFKVLLYPMSKSVKLIIIRIDPMLFQSRQLPPHRLRFAQHMLVFIRSARLLFFLNHYLFSILHWVSANIFLLKILDYMVQNIRFLLHHWLLLLKQPLILVTQSHILNFFTELPENIEILIFVWRPFRIDFGNQIAFFIPLRRRCAKAMLQLFGELEKVRDILVN